MIIFDSMKSIELYEGRVDQIWCIVRNLKKIPKINWAKVIWEPNLSPGHALYGDAQVWKQKGEWDIDKFQGEYTSRFLKEMHQKESVDALNRLYFEGKQSNILCVCYCLDDSVCHRRLVYALLQGAYQKKGVANNVFLKSESPDLTHIYERYDS